MSTKAPKFPGRPGPRKSNTSTPAPGDEGPYVPTQADKLSYFDLPRPFKSPTYTSKLPSRTATTSTSIVRKNAKQILILERERLSGGDGFLSAVHTAAKARGEVIDITKKKKSTSSGAKKGNIANLLKGRLKRELAQNQNGEGTGLGLGLGVDSTVGSGTSTPANGEEGDEDEDMEVDTPQNEPVKIEDGQGDNNGPRKEIITYHTPTAPPSLLPPKKYCDITGLHASYTDPRTKLRYKGLDVWHVVRGLGPGGDQAYLSLRGAQTSLK
uniref:INO80 complex subunit C n=1 Tax=Kwoniella bestiolae CBS 10118 TaxID=1296100 RepID=A0A1B9G2B0_9TREE|nr:INO80 complex subunit C [Kwoniella bestiolae CBS 10118]OCF25145.1 INO80 complex subunit C [Kwoniella bestiolae CBS 10118]